jgi:tetratricopeptide (TPR) repeat protein
MPKYTEFEKLQRYSDAMQKLPEETAREKVKAVSAKNVPRYLSVNSPLEVIQMFSTRLHEVMTWKLSKLERGRISFVQKAMVTAECLFQEALAAGEKRALVELGILAMEQKKNLDAFDFFQQAIKQKINGAKAANLLGILAHNVKDTANAVLYFTAAINEDESDRKKGYEGAREAYYNLGMLFDASNRIAGAIEFLKKGLEAGEINCFFPLASVYKRAGRSEDLEELLSTAMEKYGIEFTPGMIHQNLTDAKNKN